MDILIFNGYIIDILTFNFHLMIKYFLYQALLLNITYYGILLNHSIFKHRSNNIKI